VPPPIERITSGFKDIGSSLQINSLNFDLITIRNETAIARSIQNLVFTLPGERFFNSSLASRVSESLFEPMNEIAASTISEEIRNTIENYEPRVRLINVKVSPDYDNSTYYVVISYTIVGIDVSPQELSFVLSSVR